MNYTDEFEKARVLWPGVKRGLDTELKCLKKHKDWKKVIHLLVPAINQQIRKRCLKNQLGMFVPPWKHFKTWLNNRCWEEEENLPQIGTKDSRDSMKEYIEKTKKKQREEQEDWLRSKTNEALIDLRNDKSKLLAHWLIDEILAERKNKSEPAHLPEELTDVFKEVHHHIDLNERRNEEMRKLR